MGWARFDDRRVDNPKLVAAGLEAVGLDSQAICWVAAHETDGFIPEAVVRGICAMHGSKYWQQLATKLVAVGRWEPGDDMDARPGYWIHDYLDYNPSKAHRDTVRERKRANGKQGGLASGEARAKQNASSFASHGTNTRPVPMLNGDEDVKEPRDEPARLSAAAEPGLSPPLDPDAGTKMRAVKAELARTKGHTE